MTQLDKVASHGKKTHKRQKKDAEIDLDQDLG